jgi:hypothetical protein
LVDIYNNTYHTTIGDTPSNIWYNFNYNQQKIIERLERERLSSQMSSYLRRNWNYNNSSQYPDNRSVFNEFPTIPQQEKGWFNRVGDGFRSFNPVIKQQQEVSPARPVIMMEPYVKSYPPNQNSSFPSISDISQFPRRVMSGGSKIKLRTFHFLEPKSYNEHAFRAEKPIIAGKMAYDFLRTHYKLKKGSSIMFTIEDRQKDRKYNYIGEKVNNKIIIKST